MFQLLGLIGVVAMVFGGFLLAGGSADVLLAAGPVEFVMIAGAGVGTLFLANGTPTALAALKAPARVFAGSHWTEGDRADAACVLGQLMSRARRRGVFDIEADVEAPEKSALFASAPALQNDPEARDMICEIFRRVGMGQFTAEAAERLFARRIERVSAERMRPVDALERLADALPALGIVAAVLGVIKSMAAIDQSTAVLGQMIASALVGTLLGVFLSYGIVGPIASRYGQIVEEETGILESIAEAMMAWLRGESSDAAIEAGFGAEMVSSAASERVVPLRAAS